MSFLWTQSSYSPGVVSCAHKGQMSIVTKRDESNYKFYNNLTACSLLCDECRRRRFPVRPLGRRRRRLVRSLTLQLIQQQCHASSHHRLSFGSALTIQPSILLANLETSVSFIFLSLALPLPLFLLAFLVIGHMCNAHWVRFPLLLMGHVGQSPPVRMVMMRQLGVVWYEC